SDGLSSGWAGGEGADWKTIDAQRIANDAVRKAQEWRGKTSLEPGKYLTVLEPVAAGMLIGLLRGAFDARNADGSRSFFARPGGGNGIGENLFDSRVILLSDPAEKNAEASPFNNGGLPVDREAWVENGELKALAYNRFWAQRQSVAPRANPNNFKMSGG